MLRKLISRFLLRLRPEGKPSKNQWVAIGISFVLAVTLWFLVNLNTQTYTSTYNIPVKVVNIPEIYQIRDELPPTVRVTARGKGDELINEHLETSEDTIRIDFSLFESREYFIGSNNFNIVGRALRQGLEPIKMVPDSLPLVYARRATKKVPILLDLNLNLPLGYRHYGELTANQDSVLISGPEGELDKITYWRTDTSLTRRVSSLSTIKVNLESRKFFRVTPRRVDVEINPIMYTERTMKVPVRGVNLPGDTRLRLSPDSVTVSFLVPLVNYEVAETQDFHFEVDYKTLNPLSSFTIPQAKGIPESVEIQKYLPIRVKYLIIQEL